MGRGTAPLRGVWRLIGFRSVGETVAFWTVLILVFLALSVLATWPGAGYSERIACAGGCAVFDYNPILWLPFLGSNPVADPWPHLLWWVIVAALVSKAATLVTRRFMGPPAPRRFPANGAR